MSPLRPHEPICVDGPKETAHFFEVAWWFLFKDGRNSFLSRLETNWHEPVSKPIGLLDGPFTFKGVDQEAICFKAR